VIKQEEKNSGQLKRGNKHKIQNLEEERADKLKMLKMSNQL